MTSLAGIRPPPLSAPVSSLNTPREIDGVRRAKVIGKHVKPVVGGRVLLTQKESEEVDHEFRACAMRVYVSHAFLATDSSAHALLSSLTLPHSSLVNERPAPFMPPSAKSLQTKFCSSPSTAAQLSRAVRVRSLGPGPVCEARPGAAMLHALREERIPRFVVCEHYLEHRTKRTTSSSHHWCSQ